MTEPDRETRAAIVELSRRLRDDPLEHPDVLAREFIVWLRGHGWRPTDARPMPAWHRPAGHGTEPTGDYLAARQALDARLACREPEGGDAA